MVGWGFAFGRGVVILLWTIVWAIVAGIIAVLITGGTLAAVIRDPTAVASNPIGILAAFSLGIFLAVFIATIGVYASIVKVTVDGALSQMEKSGRRTGNCDGLLRSRSLLRYTAIFDGKDYSERSSCRVSVAYGSTCSIQPITKAPAEGVRRGSPTGRATKRHLLGYLG